jgi:hypothetical protein
MSAEIPDILLERYRLNELSPDEAARLDDRMRHDEPLRRRLEALDRSDHEIRQSGLLDRLSDRFPDRQPVRRRRRAFGAVPAAIAGVTVVTLMVVLSTKAPPTGRTDAVDSGDRINGLTPSLAVYRRTAEGSETPADGAVAHPGDHPITRSPIRGVGAFRSKSPIADHPIADSCVGSASWDTRCGSSAATSARAFGRSSATAEQPRKDGPIGPVFHASA